MIHQDVDCECLSSDRTGAYVQPIRGTRGQLPGFSKNGGTTHSVTMRPGSVPYVSHRPGAYSRLMLDGTHVPSWLWWCVLRGRNLLLSDRCFGVGLPGQLCRIFWPWLTTVAMDDSSYGEPVRKYVDDYYSMRSSNDNDRADPVGLSSLGAW